MLHTHREREKNNTHPPLSESTTGPNDGGARERAVTEVHGGYPARLAPPEPRESEVDTDGEEKETRQPQDREHGCQNNEGEPAHFYHEGVSTCYIARADVRRMREIKQNGGGGGGWVGREPLKRRGVSQSHPQRERPLSLPR